MIIHLQKSILFTIDPDERFAKQYNNPKGTLKDIYRRHKLLDYSTDDLCSFYEMKTGGKLSNKAMKRWIWRTEVYVMAKPMIDKGVRVVVSSFFKKYEWSVIKEISKNIKFSVHKKTKTLI